MEKKVQQTPLGDLRGEERGDAFLPLIWAGRQNASRGWVSRWNRYSIRKNTVQDLFLGLGSPLESV